MDWHTDLSVGEAELDRDHRSIFQLVDRVQSAADAELDDSLVEYALDRLVDYTDSHFAREEAYMRRIGYPYVLRHQSKHRAMIEHLGLLQSRFDQDDERVGEDLVVFLNDWWYLHILQEDMAYKHFAQQRHG